MKSEVYNIDRMAMLAKYPDKYFDWAIDDPPYFKGPEKRMFYGQKISNKGVKRIDYPVTNTWIVPGKEYFDELIRVSKNQIIWGCNYYEYVFGPGRIVWDKINHDSSFSDCELAYCSIHDTTRMFKFMWNGMLQGKSMELGHVMQGNKALNEKRIHPTQKPVPLYQWLYKKYTKQGDKIIDCHLGSGSNRIAAYFAECDFYACELDATHYANQDERYNKAIAMPLFDMEVIL